MKTAEALARLAGVASALGDSSRYLWLKLPIATVMTSWHALRRCPSCSSAENRLEILLPSCVSLARQFPGPRVRGALVGKNVLYPSDEDPLAMAEAAGGIVHESWSVETALQSMTANRRRDIDRLARLGQAR